MAEWEEEQGLPPYSVYPDAVNATKLTDKGYFMYRTATPEERQVMQKGMFMKIRKNYGDLEAIEAAKARKRERERRKWHEKKNGNA